MTIAHDPALRMALRSMLTDPAYTGAPDAREWVEGWLGFDDAWTDATRQALRRYALDWAQAQGPNVEPAIRKALGEDIETDVVLPSQARLESTRHTLHNSYKEKQSMAHPSEAHNGTAAQDTAMNELFGDTDWSELERQAERMKFAPWDQPEERIAKAVRAIKEGRVSLGSPATSLAYVMSESSQRKYTVRESGCTCQATRPCYHMTAAELYRLFLDAPHPGQAQLFQAPATEDKPVATPTEDHMPEIATEAPSVPVETLLPQTRPLTLALPLRSISAIVSDLSRPLPKECVAILPATNKRPAQSYLHWHTVATLLDAYAPGWHGSVVRVEKIGEKCAVTYRITIPTAEGECFREDAGMEDEDKDDYGDAMTNAIATAFKRAAAKFGVGRWLYEKDDTGKALLSHFKTEKQDVLADLGKLVDEKGLNRQEVITWLQKQTGAGRVDHIPLWALRSLMGHLSSLATPAA